MDKNVLFFTLSLMALYFLLDDFIGQKRITNFVTQIIEGGGVNATPPPPAPDTAPAKPDIKKMPPQYGGKAPAIYASNNPSNRSMSTFL